MAERRRDPGSGEDGNEPTGADFIEEVVPDPSAVPDLRVLAGFIGRSSREGSTRLYLTLQLNDYLEIRDADIVHTHRLASTGLPAEMTLVWVPATATIEREKVVRRRAQADFLAGEIAAGFALGSVASGSVASRGFAPSLLGPVCHSELVCFAPSLFGPVCRSELVCFAPSLLGPVCVTILLGCGDATPPRPGYGLSAVPVCEEAPPEPAEG